MFGRDWVADAGLVDEVGVAGGGAFGAGACGLVSGSYDVVGVDGVGVEWWCGFALIVGVLFVDVGDVA